MSYTTTRLHIRWNPWLQSQIIETTFKKLVQISPHSYSFPGVLFRCGYGSDGHDCCNLAGYIYLAASGFTNVTLISQLFSILIWKCHVQEDRLCRVHYTNINWLSMGCADAIYCMHNMMSVVLSWQSVSTKALSLCEPYQHHRLWYSFINYSASVGLPQ